MSTEQLRTGLPLPYRCCRDHVFCNVFGDVCAGWSDAFDGEFSPPVIFHIATQTAPKLLPSSLPGVDRRLRGVENAEHSLSHSRYHCSVLLRFDRLLALFIAGGFRTLAFWRSPYQEVHRFRYCRASAVPCRFSSKLPLLMVCAVGLVNLPKKK